MKTTTDKKASKGIKIRSAVKGGEHVLLARQTQHNAAKVRSR